MAPHYYVRNDIEAAKVIEAFELTWNVGNAVAYLLRAGKKTPDPLEDLKKAYAHIGREIALLESK